MCTTPKSTKRKSLNATPDEGLSDVSKMQGISKHFDALDQDEEQFRQLAEAGGNGDSSSMKVTSNSRPVDAATGKQESWLTRFRKLVFKP